MHNHNHNHNSLPQDVPASTGSGPNVEVTMGIIDSITKLANSPYTSMGACAGAGDESNDNDVKMEGDENDYDNDGNNDNDDNGNGNGNDENEEYDVEKYRKQERDDSKLELTYLNELSKCTNNFSTRCSKFQQYLLKLIRNTTGAGAGAGANGGASANTNANTNANGDNTNFTKKEILQVANFEGQIASLQSMCSTLQMQVEELGKARDDANNSERRVRRGLYRVASGRLKIGEVLQVS